MLRDLDYKSTLRNNSEDRRSHFHCGGSLKSLIVNRCLSIFYNPSYSVCRLWWTYSSDWGVFNRHDVSGAGLTIVWGECQLYWHTVHLLIFMVVTRVRMEPVTLWFLHAHQIKYYNTTRHCTYLEDPYNKNQQDALFTFKLFHSLTSTCFEQAYCSSSGSTTLYIQQLVYVMRLCSLVVSCQQPVNTNTWHIPIAVYTE